MQDADQADIFAQLLSRFAQEGILSRLMLIGSWCLPIYRSALVKAGRIPVMRTLDADFLVRRENSVQDKIDVPAILEEMGFVATFDRSSEWVVYDHPELRVEFLVPELGKGYDKARKIRQLGVTAQGLRYLNLLADHPRKLSYGGLPVVVPEPAAYALQKLIISERRKKAEKRERDLESAIAVLDYIESQSDEQDTMRRILKMLPRKWVKEVERVAKKHNLDFLLKMLEAIAQRA